MAGEYLLNNNEPTAIWEEQYLAHFPAQTEILLVGYLNARIGRLWEQREDKLATIIVFHDLEYQAQHFLPWSRYSGMK